MTGHSMTERPPATGRAGVAQAGVLLAAVTLPVMGVISLVPVVPALRAHFAGVAGADWLVPVALTVPGLCIALLSPVAGWLADRFGRRRLLLWALGLYGFCGLAPLLLGDLVAIIATRFGLGLAEAAIMTVTTTLTGDYFREEDRQKWVAAQAMAGSLAATLLFLAGGALGRLGWQGPFYLYALALPVWAAAAVWLWEPTPARRRTRSAPFPWRVMRGICLATLGCSVAFYAGPLQLGLRLADLGVTGTGTIGLIAGLSSLGVPLGAFLYRRLHRPVVGRVLGAALALIGAGLGVAGMVSLLPLIALAMVVAQVGCGAMMPCLMTWCLSRLDFAHRGRGSGLWTSAFFLGQFITPLTMTALARGQRGTGFAYLAMGGLCLMAGVATILARRAGPGLSSTNTDMQEG
jgi:MFS family permease